MVLGLQSCFFRTTGLESVRQTDFIEKCKEVIDEGRKRPGRGAVEGKEKTVHILDKNA